MGKICRVLASLALLAGFGYSCVLATSNPQHGAAAPRSEPLQARAVGQDLRFTNPFLPAVTDPAFLDGGNAGSDPDGFDLGDASEGVPATRYITAAGGFQPYSFSAFPLLDVFNQNPPAVPQLLSSGLLTGIITPTTVSASAFFNPISVSGSAAAAPVSASAGVKFARFTVVLNDGLGNTREGIFHFNVYPSPPEKFRFAVDRLPFAQQGNSYFTNIATLGGSGSVSCSVVAGSVLADKAYSSLEAIGLTLTPGGILYGRPISASALIPHSVTSSANSVSASATNPGITFTVHAVDSTGAAAFSRKGNAIDQTFTVPVEANSQATSELLAARCAIRGDQSTPGTGLLTYSGVLDTKGETVFSLAGSQFTLRVGQKTYSGNFDAAGRINPPSSAAQDSLTVALNPASGLIRVKISNTDLTSFVGAAPLTAAFETNLVLNMELRLFRTCDVLTLHGVARKSRYFADYALGRVDYTGKVPSRTGTVELPPAGGFQIVKMHGTDGRFFSAPNATGTPGDSWLVRYLAVPRGGIDKDPQDAIPAKINGVTPTSLTATIRLGPDFSQTASADFKSVAFTFLSHDPAEHILSLRLDPRRFLHRLETRVITNDASGLVQASGETDLTIFPFGMDVPGFSGETGRVIAPENGLWLQR